jgi:hypothetical protein
VYARSTTVVSDPSSLELGIAYLNDELMPAITAIKGCVGLSLLVDRSTGRCIATSSWRTQEAMRQSEDQVRPLRNQFVETFGGMDPSVEEWEVAVMHRDHRSPEGACARTSWLTGDPRTIEESIDSFKMILPSIEALDGFCSASLLVNRESGRAVATVNYDSNQALAQTRAQANGIRTALSQRTGAEVLEVAEFELALAHLRVPELV